MDGVVNKTYMFLSFLSFLDFELVCYEAVPLYLLVPTTHFVLQVSISSITIPPLTPGDFHHKFAPTLGFLHPSFCPGGGDLLGQLPRGGHLSIKDFCHFWNFHDNGKNWRLATDNTLAFICCSEILCLRRKLLNLKIEPKLKNENDYSDQRLSMRNCLTVGHLILRVLWKICLYK